MTELDAPAAICKGIPNQSAARLDIVVGNYEHTANGDQSRKSAPSA